MPRFRISERRTEYYSCYIEANNRQHALKLYGEDSPEIFGGQWEHDCTDGCEVIGIDEHKPDDTIVAHDLENGEFIDPICEVCLKSFEVTTEHPDNLCSECKTQGAKPIPY